MAYIGLNRGERGGASVPAREEWIHVSSAETDTPLKTFCRACGKQIDPRASICPGCGVATGMVLSVDGHHDWLVALLLSIFVGTLGVDRFYLGKVGTGILKLITAGGLGVWWIIDIILIATGSMRDAQGRPLVRSGLM